MPGAHVLVAGSNGHIAWGVTSAYGNWVDVSFVPCVSVDAQSVKTATETIPVTTVQETIQAKGKKIDLHVPVSTGPDGVLFEAEPSSGRCWFARWLATVPAATNFNISALETATTTAEAVALAPTIGIPTRT